MAINFSRYRGSGYLQAGQEKRSSAAGRLSVRRFTACIPKLTKESEERLVGCLERVYSLLYKSAEAKNSSPERILALAAYQHDVPAHHLRYLVYAFNNGIVLNQIKTARNAREKLARTPLVSLDKLVEEFYKLHTS